MPKPRRRRDDSARVGLDHQDQHERFVAPSRRQRAGRSQKPGSLRRQAPERQPSASDVASESISAASFARGHDFSEAALLCANFENADASKANFELADQRGCPLASRTRAVVGDDPDRSQDLSPGVLVIPSKETASAIADLSRGQADFVEIGRRRQARGSESSQCVHGGCEFAGIWHVGSRPARRGPHRRQLG